MKQISGTAVSMTAVIACLLCTACPSGPPGTIEDSLSAAGMKRTFLVHLPADVDAEARLPLVIALHSFTGTGRSMEATTGFSALADSEGFIVAYPDGRQRVWNANPGAPSSISGPPADDVAFIAALIDRCVDEYGADPRRVYVTGASNGGLMTHRVACELTDRLAAAASVMITHPAGWQDHEQPTAPVPFLIIHGVDDPFFPWDGGTVNEGPFHMTDYLSVEETVAFWVNNNHAVSPPVETTLPDLDPNDGTTVFRWAYAAGDTGAEVTLYGVNGGGHTWPGNSDTPAQFVFGKTSHDIDATRVIWDFLKPHAHAQ